MTIAVGGNIGAMLNLRDDLLETQGIMTSTLKYPIAVQAWNLDLPLYNSNSGLAEAGAKPVKIKVVYPLTGQGNGLVLDPTYVITDLAGQRLSGYTVDITSGEIKKSNTLVGMVRFRARDAGALTEARAQIQSLSAVIGMLNGIIGMYQKQENALLNSGAIS